MDVARRRAVVNADGVELGRVVRLVRAGRYRSVSEFVRQAITEKLARLSREDLAAQVERYCEAGHAQEDGDLVAGQAFAGGGRRASR